MKKIFTFVVLMLAVFSWSADVSKFLANDDERQALYGAIDKAFDSLKKAPFGKKPIVIAPMEKGHHDIVAVRLKNMLTKAGFICIEGKEDPMWNKIIEEIEWSAKKDDILDPSTIAKFGKLKAAKILFDCKIRLIDKNSDRIYVEVEMQATEISTRTHLWGGTFATRYYIGKDLQGIIALDQNLMLKLQEGFEQAKKKMTSPEQTEKFKNVKTIAVVPIIGDIDYFITNLATVMISQTRFSPQNPHIPSLAQVRSATRDGLLKSDAVFYGSVRALHKTQPVNTPSNGKMLTKYSVVATIQLFVEEAKTENILWGDTIQINDTISTERNMTAAEMKKYRQEKMDAIPGEITESITDNWKSYLKTLGIIGGIIIALIIAIVAFKALFSFNNVR